MDMFDFSLGLHASYIHKMSPGVQRIIVEQILSGLLSTYTVYLVSSQYTPRLVIIYMFVTDWNNFPDNQLWP